MANLVLSGDTSGTVTLSAPAVSGSTTLTLPTTSSTLATLAAQTFTGTQTITTLTSPASTALTLQSAGTTAVTINTSQTVGIGTTSLNDSFKLNVSNAGSSALFYDTSAVAANIGGSLYFGGTYTGSSQTTFGYVKSGKDNATDGQYGGYLSFATRANGSAVAEAMRIDSSGNVGIGTTSPNTKLEISGSSTFIPTTTITADNAVTGWRVRRTGGTYPIEYYMGIRENSTALDFYDNTSNALRMRIDSSGNLLVPQAYNNTTGSGANGFIAGNGTFQRSTSSLKYKKNVANATHGLTDLLKLRSVTYEGKAEGDSGKTFGGLIAEEVHDAGLTEFVQYAEDGSPDALAYGNMVALCVKSIQELKAINDTQAETINALTARIVALESK